MKKILFAIAILTLLAFIILFTFLIFQKKYVYPIKYQAIVEKNANIYAIDKYLIYSVIKTESGFDERARSSKNAIGLMQITESTGKFIAEMLVEDFKVENLENPEINIRYGTYYLFYLKSVFENEKSAIAAYNAGEGNVKKWLKDKEFSDDKTSLKKIPFKETANYVERVERSCKKYKKIYE